MLEKSLDDIGSRYSLYWRAGSRFILLNRRFANPKEYLNLELEELRFIARDLHTIIQPFTPYRLDSRYTVDQNAFYLSLSSTQLAAMRRGNGVAFRELAAAQREHWHRINLAHEYCDEEMLFERAARIYAKWKQTAFKYHTLDDGTRVLFFMWPGADGKLDVDGVELPPLVADLESGSKAISAVAGELGEFTAGVTFLPPSFRAAVRGLETDTSVRELETAIEHATGNELLLPEYARDRRLFVLPAADTNAGDLVAGLASLYGWDVQFVSGKRWSVGRSTPGRARTAHELHQMLNREIPPSLSLIVRSEADTRTRQTRYAGQYHEIVLALKQFAKGDPKRVPITSLPMGVQRLVANLIITRELHEAIKRFGSGAPPRWTVTAEETGFLSLEGEGEHPTLLFRVPRPDGRADGWGWVVGSSSRSSQ